MKRTLFTEEQKFTQWWMKAILLFTLLSVFVPFAYGIYSQEVLGEPLGSESPMTTGGLIVTGITSLFIVGLMVMFFVYVKLKTKITNEGLFVTFPPFINKWKKFTPKEIEKYEVRRYNAMREYGGYGFKRRLRHGQSYTISGRIGLQLYLKNGKKLLIGTQRKQAIEYAMAKLKWEENSARNG